MILEAIVKKISAVLCILLVLCFSGCSGNGYDETEISPTKFADIIGMSVDEVETVKIVSGDSSKYAAKFDYNVYGTRMSMNIGNYGKGDEEIVGGYNLNYKVLGPTVEDCLVVRELYDRMCEEYGEPSSGVDFSEMTDDEICRKVEMEGNTGSFSAYWNYSDDIEIELRHQLTNKTPWKDMEASANLDIAIIVGWPMEKIESVIE